MKAKYRFDAIDSAPWVSGFGFAILSVILCLLASGVAGRALWCDEILRINGQSMTVSQLMHFEHLKTFCTQTTAAYLFMRPWQLLFGMETGGYLLSALSGGIITLATLLAISLLLGWKKPRPIVSLLVSTNPLLVYYGSELAFYGMWSAAGAVVFALLVKEMLTLSKESRTWTRRTLALMVAGTALVAFHFAGIFVWSAIAAASLICIWNACGIRKALAHVLIFAIPVVVNLPMYIGSMRAPEHLGSKGLQLEKLGSVLPSLWGYVSHLFPALTGGWWIGATLFLAGSVVMLRGDSSRKRVFCIALISSFAVVPFLAYSYLREYMPPVSRYWVCSITPALTLVALGLDSLLSKKARMLSRLSGWTMGAAVLGCNILVCAALVTADGRPQPYKRLQQYVGTLPPSRNVVFSNHYENRFFGGYYKLPSKGRMGFPSIWEEGPEARARGLQAIWKLLPDAVCYANFSEVETVLKQAGIVKSGNGLKWRPSPLMQLVYKLHLHPEPPTEAEKPLCLLHETMESIAESSEQSTAPVVVPSPGWILLSYREPSGKMQFGIIAQGPSFPDMKIFIPKSAEDEVPWKIDLEMLAHMNVTLDASLDGRRLDSPGLLRKTSAQCMFIPSRQTFNDLPRPDDWLNMGHQFVIKATPTRTTLPLGALAPGWHTLTIRGGGKNAPLVITAHHARP